MSRIGKLPITVPSGVTVTIGEDNLVTIKGPKGTLSQKVHKDITVKHEGAVITVSRPSDAKPHKAMHGLYRALLHNLVVGVTNGFEKRLHMEGVGYSHPVVIDAPENISFETPQPTEIVVKGIDKQQVGAVAADIRAIRKPEPYLGKGIRYVDEVVRRKEGKAGKK